MFRQAQHDDMEKSKIFLVIQSVSEESRGNETSLYTRHFTSFRYREIATPNKSARNDKVFRFGWNTHKKNGEHHKDARRFCIAMTLKGVSVVVFVIIIVIVVFVTFEVG